jgi:hypothetical protein
METVTALTERRPESFASVTSTPMPDAGRALTVTATYMLSEEGRKASLLVGGDGRAVQQVAVQVPINRLHLVSVDVNGVARLKLRPRYQLDDAQRVVRIDAAPVYDAPPEIEDLFLDAARNHQLERAYETERRAARANRRDAGRERRTQLAQAFLDDSTQRALVHPPPTPKSCYLATDYGRALFDANSDDAPARDVPIEAHRRFRADLRARREENLRRRAEQVALHKEKIRFIADWITAHGTPDQQARQAAGVLPIEEAIEAITDEAFAVLANLPRYLRDGVERLQAHLRQLRQHSDAILTRDDLLVTSANAKEMTAVQWGFVDDVHKALPNATITLRTHRLSWKRDGQMTLTVFAVVVAQQLGPFMLRREYGAPSPLDRSDRWTVAE